MKRITFFLFIVLSLLAQACVSRPSPTPAVTQPPPSATLISTPSPTAAPSRPAGRCGDSVCDGPENAANCPADCATPATLPPPIFPPGLPDPTTLHRPERLQIGLNFIRFYMGNESYFQPETIFADFEVLGIQTYRQLVLADLMWDVVEPQDDQWNFAPADAVLTNPDFEPIVTLFAMQFSSPTPPWVKDAAQFERALGPEAQEYLETVIARYGPYVKYWELGNEMDHWRAADPGETPKGGGNAPPLYPEGGYSPKEQGIFLAQAAAFIRARDPDAVIILPGISGPDDYVLNTWLTGVLEGGGTEWFDVVNYHYYSSWEPYTLLRRKFQTYLEGKGIADKPVWLTETGASASPTLTDRTNYPNSPETQAADIFRRIIQAYGAGDALVIWHTYIDSPNTPANDWRLYGIRSDQGQAHPSYGAFKLLMDELIPFAQVEALANDPRKVNAYRITTEAGEIKYVLWGNGFYATPVGMTQMTSVIPDANGNFVWQAPPAQIELSANPILVK